MNFRIFDPRPEMQERNFVFNALLPCNRRQLLNIHLDTMMPHGNRRSRGTPPPSRVPHHPGLPDDPPDGFAMGLRTLGLEGLGNPDRAM